MTVMFKGKTVVITGASCGIGEGTAVHFAGLGARLVLSGRNADNLERVANRCVEAGCSKDYIVTVPGDITLSQTREIIINKCIEKFNSIDVLFNNAGMVHARSIGEITPQQYEEMMNTNVNCHVYLTQLAIPHLIKSKGCIVNNSSVGSVRPVANIGVYCMTKAAIDCFTKCLALELAPDVRVNAINPTTVVSNIFRRKDGRYVDDENYERFLKREAEARIHPLGRVGQPEDCAAAVAFLASDAASFITGHLLFVDGGRASAPVL